MKPAGLLSVGMATILAVILTPIGATAAPPDTGAAATAVAASSPDPWVLSNSTYSSKDYLQMPYIGNGFFGTRVPQIGQGAEFNIGSSGWPWFYEKNRPTTALIAGLFGDRRLASTPTWTTLDLVIGDAKLTADVPASQISQYSQKLDQSTGTVTTQFRWTPTAGRETDVRFTVLANRERMHLGQAQVTVTPQWSGSLDIESVLDGRSTINLSGVAHAVDLTNHLATVELKAGDPTGTGKPAAATAVLASQLVAGDGVAATSTALLPNDLTTAGEKVSFPVVQGRSYTVTKYVGMSTSLEPGTPRQVAEKAARDAKATGWDALVKEHERAWQQLWAPNTVVPGNPELQSAINAQFYTLYSSVREGLAYPVGPAGLSSNDYAGWAFWDADTWIFPALLAFHPELAKAIVQFRANTLDQAKLNAVAKSKPPFALKGAIWPWTSWGGAKCGECYATDGQVHLQSDISLAQWQYFAATGDTQWLKAYGYPVISAVADYWTSRVVNRDGNFHIDNVKSADEHASGKNDDAATNAGAIVSLRHATTAAQLLGVAPDPTWATVADGMYIPVDADGTHPEYAGYTSEKVKQASTILMSYPYEYITDRATAAADLNRYLPVMDDGGPAMTASAEAVVAARAQQPGCLANTLFEASYKPFLRGAFNQFLETQFLYPSAGQGYPAFNFLTGSGGFLGVAPYGFAGLSWGTDALTIAPTLPPQLADGVSLKGIKYHGSSLTIDIGPSTTKVSLDSGKPVTIRTGNRDVQLTAGSPLTVETARPDLAPTDNLARCATVTATSTDRAERPEAAVDGSAFTRWTAGEATSSLTVQLARPTAVSQATIDWGRSLPATVKVEVPTSSGGWDRVGDETPTDFDEVSTITWPSVVTSTVRLTFTGGDKASIDELNLTAKASAVVKGTVFEAESATLVGNAAPRTDHGKFSGKGFVPLVYSGDGVEISIPATVAGEYTLAMRYSNGKNAPRTISVSGGGLPATQVTLPRTADWESWATVTTRLTLPAGVTKLSITVNSGDTAQINLDRVVLSPPPAVAVPENPKVSTVEAEDSTLLGTARMASDHPGYTGKGFVPLAYKGQGVDIAVRVDTAGDYSVALRYANGMSDARTLTLIGAGGFTATVTLKKTGDWNTWSTTYIKATLPAGDSSLRVVMNEGDTGRINLDSVTVGTRAEGPVPVDGTVQLGEIVEAEKAKLTGSASVATNHKGFTGGGFVASFYAGAAISAGVTVPAAGDYVVRFTYSNSTGGQRPPYESVPRTVTVEVEGGSQVQVTLPTTPSWDEWSSAEAQVTLPAGVSNVGVSVLETDSGSVNIDNLTVVAK